MCWMSLIHWDMLPRSAYWVKWPQLVAMATVQCLKSGTVNSPRMTPDWINKQWNNSIYTLKKHVKYMQASNSQSPLPVFLRGIIVTCPCTLDWPSMQGWLSLTLATHRSSFASVKSVTFLTSDLIWSKISNICMFTSVTTSSPQSSFGPNLNQEEYALWPEVSSPHG